MRLQYLNNMAVKVVKMYVYKSSGIFSLHYGTLSENVKTCWKKLTWKKPKEKCILDVISVTQILKV